MNGYIYGKVQKYLWRKVFVVGPKKCMRVNRYIPFRVDTSVGTPVDESKGHCAGYAKK